MKAGSKSDSGIPVSKLSAAPEKISAPMESPVIKGDAPLQSRENLADTREQVVLDRETAVQLREGVADVRQTAADARESVADVRDGEIHATKTNQAAAADQMSRLQQANAHLVTATLEAQKLAEQVQMARVQMEHDKCVAEKANTEKSVFLSNMSHELRTPLNAILGFAQLLEAGSPPPTASQLARLQQISKAGWYLLELINEILDLAVIESGKISLSREPVSLTAVMRECASMVESLANKHDVSITFPRFDTDYFVNADQTRMKQILVNLLSNAVKYNHPQGTVEVKCSVSTERIRINVKDSGTGLSPEKLAHLFEPFNRLGQETGSEEGTGIGLVVTKRLVELMGGIIGVESIVGVGSVFWIELLREDIPQLAFSNIQSAEHTPLARDISQAENGVTQHTMLYVEDNPANLMLVEQIIARHPRLKMLSACDAIIGIALARAHLPDLILMDINLPGINGIEALHILRADPITQHIPVLALSANAMLSDIEKGVEAGFFRYLTKPIKIDEFMLALDEALKFAGGGGGGKCSHIGQYK